MIFPAGTIYAPAAHALILDRMERRAAPNWRLIAPAPGFGRHDPLVLALMGQNR